MPAWKIGDRAQVITRTVTEEDRKKNRYYDHMAGLVGTIQDVYGVDEVALQIDVDTLSAITADVHKVSTQRMRAKFVDNVSEEQRKALTKEELEFDCHYVLLVRSDDLVKSA